MKIECAYKGRNEYICFVGSAQVGILHEISGWYFPIVIIRGQKRFGRSMRSLESAKAWIAVALREKKRK